MFYGLSLVITLLLISNALAELVFDRLLMWQIFTSINPRDINSFLIANPSILDDENFVALAACRGSFVCAFEYTRHRVFLSFIPHDNIQGMFVRASLNDELRPVATRLIEYGQDPSVLMIPYLRSVRLGMADRVEWMKAYLGSRVPNVTVNKLIDAKLLLKAAENGQVDLVNDLIRMNVDVNVKDKYQQSALIIATMAGHPEIANALILSGADVEAVDREMKPAILYAVETNNLPIVNALIKAGARIPPTALCTAAREGADVALVIALLDAGLSVNSRNHYGQTALMVAVDYGQTEIVRVLEQRGADLNASDGFGYTALILTVRNGDVEIINILLKAGAKVETASI